MTCSDATASASTRCAIADDRKDDDGGGFAELIVKIGAALGFNEVRLRWKLRRWGNSAQRFKRRAEQRADHVKYAHKTCGECGAVQDKDAKRCASCGAKLRARQWQMLRRIGLTMPEFLSISTLIGAGIAICYVMEIAANGGQGLLDMSAAVVIDHGGNYAPMTRGGDWWRLGTAMFLHFGLWHAGFNLFALSIVGPHVEDMYGRPFAAFLYLVTGIAASVASLFITDGFSAGASGAIMGLIGVAAAAGHMEGTSSGKAVRDQMLKWLVYTTLFGFVIGADHAAHFGGFAAGALFGALVKPRAVYLRKSKTWASVLGLVSVVALAAIVFFTLFPPRSAYVDGLTNDYRALFDREFATTIQVCDSGQAPDEWKDQCTFLEDERRRCSHGEDAWLDDRAVPEERARFRAYCAAIEKPAAD